MLKAAVEGKLTEDWRVKNSIKEPASKLLERILVERRRRWEEVQYAKYVETGQEPPKNWREKYKEPIHQDGLFDLPGSWVWASAQEICLSVENGNTPPAGEMYAGQGEIPFIKVYNLTKNGELDFTINPTFIKRQTHESLLKKSAIRPNDILMNIVGPPLGKVSIVPDSYSEWNTNQAVVIFRPSKGILTRYLTAALLCEQVLYWITRTAKATAGQYNISVGNSRLIPIPLPPIPEQEEIVSILDEKLDLIKRTMAAVELQLVRANRLRQAILKKAFEGKLLSQDPSDEPASVLLERIKAEREVVGDVGKKTMKRQPRKKVNDE